MINKYIYKLVHTCVIYVKYIYVLNIYTSFYTSDGIHHIPLHLATFFCLINVKMLEIIYTLNDPSVCLLSHFSRVQLYATLWTVACQAPLCMGFSRQEYLSGLPCPSPRESSQPRMARPFPVQACKHPPAASVFSPAFRALGSQPGTKVTARSPGMGEPGGLPSMGLHRVGHN